MTAGLEFSPVMTIVMILSFLAISFFMGMLLHSSLVYDGKENLK